MRAWKDLSDEERADKGFPKVEPTDKPDGDVVTETIPVLIDGVWTQQWAVRDFTTDEVAANLQAEREEMLVTMAQARLVLLGANLLSGVDAAIASLPSPQKEAAEIEWQYQASVRRLSPLVASLGPALGLSDAQLDDLFRQASAI